MKKIIFILLILIPIITFAWEDCPFGEVNDPYPGYCGRYTDTDHDKICDLSQPAPENRDNNIFDIESIEISEKELKSKTVFEISKIYKIDSIKYADALSEYYKMNIKETDSFQLLHDNYGVEPNIAKSIAKSLKDVGPVETTEPQKEGKQVEVIKPEENKRESIYHLLSISF